MTLGSTITSMTTKNAKIAQEHMVVRLQQPTHRCALAIHDNGANAQTNAMCGHAVYKKVAK